MIGQAVLLLGGRGTRLWPLTDSRPKGLLPVGGLPFIEYQLRLLEAAGVEEVILAVSGDHEDAWRSFAADRGPIELRVVTEIAPLDTAGKVVEMARAGQLADRFLCLNGDVLFEADLSVLIKSAPPTPALLVLARVEDPSAFGVVVAGSDGMVRGFVEKPPREEAPADTVSAGIYLLEPQVVKDFGPGPVSFERTIWPTLTERGDLGAVVTEGTWMDIGTPGLYLEAHDVVLRGGLAHHRSGAPLYVSPSARMEGSAGGRWVWVGDEVTVEAGALVEESVVLGGAVIEADATVRSSIVGWGAQVGAGCSVSEQSVIGEGAAVGAGSELARGLRVAPSVRLEPGSISFSPPS